MEKWCIWTSLSEKKDSQRGRPVRLPSSAADRHPVVTVASFGRHAAFGGTRAAHPAQLST
jgi:hypothetical protein